MSKRMIALYLICIMFVFSGLSSRAQNDDSLIIRGGTNQQQNIFRKILDTSNDQLIVHYNQEQIIYVRPKFGKLIRNLPDDMWQITKSPFQRSNLKPLGIVVASTAILLPFDKPLIEGVERISSSIGLSSNTQYGIAVGSGEIKIIKYPKNLNSAFYQLGEGGTSMFLAGGLWIYGKINKDYRAVQTSYDLAETFVMMGITTQIMKRMFGRETPSQATQKGGAWRPFPSFKAFQQHTPKYDAFPSGHLATMMATVTVLASNYPEKKWIKPVGYVLMGITGWSMMNTETHWISDYPMALALGYLSGKISAMRHTKQKTTIKGN